MQTNNNKSKYEKLAHNYFLKNDTLKYVGAVVLIVSLACLAFRFGIIGILLTIIGTPTGIVLYIIGSNSKFSDADIDAQLESRLSGLNIDIDNERRFHLKLLKHQSDMVLEGYHFSDGVMLKKTKNSGIRTSRFTKTKLRILSDRLYIVSRNISLLDDETTDYTYELVYEGIKEVSVKRDEKRVIFNNETFFIKPCYLSIVTEEEELLFPMANAVTSDDIALNINRQIKLHLDGDSLQDFKNRS